MTYTEQQLADLYQQAVSAEAEEKREDAYKDETWALDEAVLALAPGGYAQLIRVLIDQLRAANRNAEPAMGPNGMDHFTIKLPTDLCRSTQYLIVDTAQAMGDKLLTAQNKRPADPVGWMRTDWEDDCRAGLMKHIEKGDPRDVMAYAAFMHYHGWKTSKPELQQPTKPVASCIVEDGCMSIDGFGEYAGHSLPDGTHELYAVPPINTGLSWEDYRAVSDLPDVHEAIQDLMGDTTEDNAINLIRCIAEALRPRPRFWVDVHGYQTYLLWSEADAVKHCNETGGLYVLPLFAGEPINCKLPVSMCQQGKLSDVVEVNRLMTNLLALPQKYTTPHIAIEDVVEIINQLRKPQ